MQTLAPNSERTYAPYVAAFERFLDGRQPTVELGEAFLQQYRDRGAKKNTVGVAARALRRFYGLQVAVPSIEMSMPQYLSLDELQRLIKKAPTLLEKTIIIVMFSTGCRISEVLNITLEDLELDKGVVTVTRKGGNRERIPLGKEGTEALKAWLKARQTNDKRVFMDYTYNNIYYRMKQAAKKAKIKGFHSHILRHSRGRHLIEAGIPIEKVSEVLGHKKLDTTLKIYGALRAEDRAKYLVKF